MFPNISPNTPNPPNSPSPRLLGTEETERWRGKLKKLDLRPSQSGRVRIESIQQVKKNVSNDFERTKRGRISSDQSIVHKSEKHMKSKPKAMKRFRILKAKLEESARRLAEEEGREYVTEDMLSLYNKFVDSALHGKINYVRKRIKEGQNLEWQHTELGYTALIAGTLCAGHDGGWFSADVGQSEVVLSLIEAGACVNTASDCTGETALHCAAANGRSSIVQLLLDRGANKRLKDNSGLLPLDKASEFCGELSHTSMLLRDMPVPPNGKRCINVYAEHYKQAESHLRDIERIKTENDLIEKNDNKTITLYLQKSKDENDAAGGLDDSFHPFEIKFKWTHGANANQYLAPVLDYQLRWRPAEDSVNCIEELEGSIYGKEWLFGPNYTWPSVEQGWRQGRCSTPARPTTKPTTGKIVDEDGQLVH